MGKIARAGIAIAAVAALAGGVWLALRPRAAGPPANEERASAADQTAVRPTAAKPFAVADDSPTLRVLDRDTGAPIDGAWVEFDPEGSDEDREGPDAARILAGADGCVRIPLAVLESNDWRGATVGGPDHLAVGLDVEDLRPLFFARPASEPETVPVATMWLDRGSELAGRVIDEDGRPIEGVRVSAWGPIHLALSQLHPGLEDQERVWSFDGTSDREGRFRVRRGGVTGIDDGSIDFEKEGYLPAQEEIPPAGELVLTLTAATRIAGRVMAPEGSPIGGAAIEVRPAGAKTPAEDARPSAKARSESDGSFTLVIAARLRHTIAVERRGFHPSEIPDYVPDAGKRLDIVLRPRSRGTARLLAGDPPAPVRGAAVHVFLPIQDAGVADPERTDAEGRIRVALAPGDGSREIVFVAPDVGFAKLDVQVVEDREQDLGDLLLDPGHTLDVAFADADGAPMEGQEVSLELVDSDEKILHGLRIRAFFSRSGRSDASGRIAFSHLPAGLYLLASDDIALRRYPKVPGESPLAIRVLPRARITGVVVDLEGISIPQAMVGLSGSADACMSDARGRFVLSLPEAPDDPDPTEGAGKDLRLEFSHPRFVDKEISPPRMPRAGETIDLGTIVLDPGGCLIVEVPGIAFEEWETSWQLDEADEHPGRPWSVRERGKRAGDRLLIEALPAGTYLLRIEIEDHPPWRSEPIAIASGQTRTITVDVQRGLELAGRVVDAETGAPIAQAWIWVDSLGGARSDEDGRFHLVGLEPVAGELSVQASGYADVSFRIDVAEGILEPIRMRRSEETEERSHILPTTRLLLRILRPDGLPVRRSDVCAIETATRRSTPHCGFSKALDCHVADVGSAGPFRFRVWSEASPPSAWIDVPGTGARTIGPLPVTLGEGPPTRFAVRLGDGSPVAGARVHIIFDGFLVPGRGEGITDARGEIALRPLPPETITVEVKGRGIPRTTRTFEYSGRGEILPIVVGRAATLQATLRFAFEVSSLRISLGDVDVDEPSSSISSPYSLRIDAVPAGTHSFQVLARDTGLPYVEEMIAFAEGETVSLDFALPMGSIEGRITGAGRRRSPLGALVMLRVAGSWEHGWMDCRADSAGRFTFTGIPPGRYRLALRESTGVRPGREVEVRDGEMAQVELEGETWTLRGTIASVDGSPVHGAKVRIEEEDPFRGFDTFDVWASGRFALFDVAAGPQALIVRAPGFMPCRRTIDMDRDRSIDIVLAKGALVSVTIVDSAGSDAAARVSWRAADGSSGYVGLIGATEETWIPPAAVSLRFETESGAIFDVSLVKAEGGGFAPVRAVIPEAEEDR